MRKLSTGKSRITASAARRAMRRNQRRVGVLNFGTYGIIVY